MLPQVTTNYEQGATLAHKNDHVVQIIRTKSFLERAQNASTNDFFAMSKLSVGPYFQKASPTVATGLSLEEINLLMGTLLDMDPKDREFRKSVEKFFNELFTPIPPGDAGLRLNIGLQEDNSKPVSSTNMPINLMDFIRYRHALGHRWVAPNPQLAIGNQMKKFFVSDPLVNSNKSAEQGDALDKALEIYLSVKNSENKVDMMLTLLGIDPVALVANKPGKKLPYKTMALKAVADKAPEKFLLTYGQDNFSERYLCRALIQAKIWNDVSGRILDKSNKIIAENELAAVVWLKDPSKSNLVLIFKAALQDYLKGVVPVWEQPAPIEDAPPATTAADPAPEPDDTTTK